MRPALALLCFASFFPLATVLSAANTLDIYALDVEGGKADIVVTPAGQTILLDAGMPTRDNRDLDRVLKAAKQLNIKEFDYIITTHYDVDHSGNIPAVAAQIPAKVYIDHGDWVNNPKIAAINKNAGDAYLAFVKDKKRMSVKPGDDIPLKGLKVTVLTSREEALTKPLKGAGKPNSACPATAPEPVEMDDNSGSIGTLWQYGNFRMADFGDLLHWVEYKAVCPDDKIGKVDLFMVNHHGLPVSNSPELLNALQPKAAIMNNGERKGGSAEVMKILRAAPRFQDLWQLHRSTSAGEANSPEDYIANMKQQDCQAFTIKVSANKDGSFTVTNMRNNFSKTYKK